MGPEPEDFHRHGQEAVRTLQKLKNEEWEQRAKDTVLTQRQVEMWELAVRYDQKHRYVASEYDVKETTVSRHVERVRKKAAQAEEKIEELQAELRKWEATTEYLDPDSE